MPPTETVAVLRRQMEAARASRYFIGAGSAWPLPSDPEAIAPLRTLSQEDMEKAVDRTRKRGVARLTIAHALTIAAADNYSFGDTIDFLDEIVPIGGEPA